MTQWEYRTLREPVWNAPNDLGREGWELVCVNNGKWYFKRPIPESTGTP
jgi:hypothetical protein